MVFEEVFAYAFRLLDSRLSRQCVSGGASGSAVRARAFYVRVRVTDV